MNLEDHRFTIRVDDAVLADLQLRLRNTRWPATPPGPPWRWGTSIDYLREVVDHWHRDYDWTQWEQTLNGWPHYRFPIGALKIHTMVVQGVGPAPAPLLLTHGWPSSIAEYLDVIGPLTDPARHGGDPQDAFTVVIPSLPGFGWSDAPSDPIGPREIARLWSTLMGDVLGHQRYFAQGGDWGAAVTSWMAVDHPDPLAAIHLSTAFVRRPVDPAALCGDSVEDLDHHDRLQHRRRDEMAYVALQSTKPLTLTYALDDSPAGLAGWILEKYQGWTRPGTGDEPPFPLDRLITNLMVYWLNGTGPAAWLYTTVDAHDPPMAPFGRRVHPPAGFLLGERDVAVPPPDAWLRACFDVRRVRRDPEIGHFPAFEAPGTFVQELQEFFRPFRSDIAG